ncbi:MAG: YdiU family protein [Saprospiraceae bacterium]|nr:YdiU family protein [Saprospiraceae bacterium]
MKLHIKDKFNQELPADPSRSNTRRQVFEACFSYVTPRVPSNPKLLHVSAETANLLGLTESDWNSEAFLSIFSGSSTLKDSAPYAMCYGGHQFGNWAGQLGDGRAINLAEVENEGQSWALQLKGAGETPYSRRADGLAVLRSSIREHLCSEAMYHLGVPTTRSLSLLLSGDQVLRDVMYDGNAAYEKGAVVCRVAPSFIRFGNFQIFTSRGDIVNLRKLTDFTIKHFFPSIQTSGKEAYIEFYQQVAKRTLDMIVHWQRVGFVHGVMNTDNMSILGLTIDYGPYGWLEGYDPTWTPNTTDRQNRRYRFGQQAGVAAWNLLQLANALYPLVEEAEPFTDVLQQFQLDYRSAYLNMMGQKLGLTATSESYQDLVSSLEKNLQLTETDMTIFFRNLGDFKTDVQKPGETQWFELIKDAFYEVEEVAGAIYDKWQVWFDNYHQLLEKEQNSDADRRASMNQVNPKYVLRNYMAQLAIDAANQGDYTIIEELYELLKHPYAEQSTLGKWFAKRPEWARHKVGCSMLSCSS